MWADRVWRADNGIIKTVLVKIVDKKIKRPRGRSKQRWLHVVKRDVIQY